MWTCFVYLKFELGHNHKFYEKNNCKSEIENKKYDTNLRLLGIQNEW